jgi:hypothetical protein
MAHRLRGPLWQARKNGGRTAAENTSRQADEDVASQARGRDGSGEVVIGGHSLLAQGLRLLATVIIIAAIFERSLYGVLLTSVGLILVFLIARAVSGLIFIFLTLHGIRLQVFAFIYYFLMYSMILHWILFGLHSHETVYLDFTPLVVDGSVTFFGHMYSLGLALLFASATVFFVKPLGDIYGPGHK